jgi:hypothetical protein
MESQIIRRWRQEDLEVKASTGKDPILNINTKR